MNETHLRAVFLMLAGRSVAAVSQEFKICRTILYKLRRRAMDAVRREIERPIEKKSPVHNRLPIERENKVVKWCERHPTLSSYRVGKKLSQLENETVNPKTIQRIRKRHSLPRVSKRPIPTFKAHRLSSQAKVL